MALVSLFFLYPEYSNYEQANVKEEVTQLYNLVDREIEHLDLYSRDWALWTDAWQFVQDGNSTFRENNLGASGLQIGEIDLFFFMNKRGELLHAGWINPEEGKYEETVSGPVPLDYQLFSFLNDDDHSEKMNFGVIQSKDNRQTYLYSHRNILKSDITGPSQGSLIAGRLIDSQLLSKFSTLLQRVVSLKKNLSDQGTPFDLTDEKTFFMNKTISQQTGYWEITIPLQVSHGNTPIYLSFLYNPIISNHGIRTVLIINAIIMVTFILLLGLQQLWLFHGILKPIAKLNRYIKKQHNLFNENNKFGLISDNEIKRLTFNFHFLLNKLFEINKQLLVQANTDDLTSLANRNVVMELLEKLCNLNKVESPSSFCVFMIDIDFFKRINDTYGHTKGDEVLEKLGPIIKSCLREKDIVGRYGGEEFIAVIQDIPFSRIKPLAERIRQRIERTTWSFNEKITISIGFDIAKKSSTAKEIIHSADQYLYTAKRSGRNRVEGPLSKS